jgi:hypothetical protein
MVVVSESYQKYDNGAVSDQLTDAGRRGMYVGSGAQSRQNARIFL